jgi:gas vesicle protein
VCDLVLSFNNRLNELATLAKLEDEIRKDASKKRKLRTEIDKAKELITNSKHTQDLTNEIDRTNYTAEAERDIVTAISDAKRQFRGLVSGKSYKVDVIQAQAQSNSISTQFSQCAAQVNVRINGIIENSFKNTLSKVINQYLSQLAILGVTPQSLMLGSYSGRFVTTPDMNKKLKANKSEYDESYIIQESYREKVESTKGTYGRVGALSGAGIGAIVGSIVPVIGTGVGALVGGIFGLITGRTSGESEHYVTKYRPKKIEKYVDYVNMHEVATSASHDFDQLMDEIQQKALDYMSRENDKIKKSIKVKLQEIDLLLLKKLEDLQTLENSDKKTAEEMAKKEKDLAWLTRIQTRVNELIDF